MIFFKKKQSHPPAQALLGKILYQKGEAAQTVDISEFGKISGVRLIQELDFSDGDVFRTVTTKIEKLQEKGKLSCQQVWLGKYFQNEIDSQFIPPLSIRWIDDEMGWGVFAEKDFKKMDFIAEYTGLIRKGRRSDKNNGYCFEYLYAPGIGSPYTIDAQDQGGVARFINHSNRPNLDGAIVTFNSLSHVVLFVKEPIAKGTQLAYDYGPAYWSRREKPRPL